MKKKAFTLIELIAVLVILAILALIVTPLVMNIIRKARIAADKRSIDAYGRSIELAIATYLLDNGDFPTSINDLTIEYSGDQVVCSTTQLNSESSVYLTGCTVAGRSVDYEYGSDNSLSYEEYEVGDEVTYNNVNYYVIKHSGINESTVILLKAEPLTVAEVNQYGVGHVNRYTYNSVGVVYDYNGYGGMAYYSSETCGYVEGNYVGSGCTTDYEKSDIKYVVDAWKIAIASEAIEARLITYDELFDNAEVKNICTYTCVDTVVLKYNWLYSSNYAYYTLSSNDDTNVWSVSSDGILHLNSLTNSGLVRPVITIDKSLLN